MEKIPIVQLEITHCQQCPHYATEYDPDPNDWFCDDDMYGFCKATPNDARKPDSNYVSDRSPFKVLFRSYRPHEVRDVKIPEWCPLRKEKS